MITRRARRWLQRGTTITIIVIVMVLAASVWMVSGNIEKSLLRVAGTAEETDPASVDVEFEETVFVGPLGAYPAWQIAGTDDTWVIFVHGSAGTREQSLDALEVVAGLDFPSLVISYRNDARAPASDSRHHTMGSDEWEDLEAAAVHAFREGALDLVLFGFDSGGSVILKFLRDSSWSERVRAVILDSPLLDAGRTADHDARDGNIPSFVTAWARSLATLRFGVEWADLNHVARAEEIAVPVLLIHGDADDTNPIEVSDDFSEAVPDLAGYLRLPAVGHLGAFGAAPIRYAGAVTTLLEDRVKGSSDLAPIDPERLEPAE